MSQSTTQLGEQIKEIIENEPVSVFMKGTPQLDHVWQLRPGAACAARGRRAGHGGRRPARPADRQELSALSGWPTIPQVFIKGELIGGADIVEELYASGELQAKLDEALGTDREPSEKTAAVAETV